MHTEQALATIMTVLHELGKSKIGEEKELDVANSMKYHQISLSLVFAEARAYITRL